MAKDEAQPQYVKKLGEFISELGRWGKNKVLWEYGEDYVRAKLYTDGHIYYVRAHENGYLGCVVSARKPRPGEDWTRGSDLADGKLDAETWNRILRDIVAYELKSISDYILNPPKEVPSEEGPVIEEEKGKS